MLAVVVLFVKGTIKHFEEEKKKPKTKIFALCFPQNSQKVCKAQVSSTWMVLLILSHSSLRPSCRCLQFPHIHPARLVLSVMVLLLLRHHAHSVPAGLQADHAAPHSSMLWPGAALCTHQTAPQPAHPHLSQAILQMLNKPAVSSSSHEIKRLS